MLRKSDLFNDDSICIFTDSSFTKDKSYPASTAIGTTAPAYCIYKNDTIIEQGYYILHNSTSQQGELAALSLGITASYKYKNYPHIRIFADNQNAVLSIREWIFSWVNKTARGEPALGENGRISNQSYIMDIIYSIIYNNIFLELYHVKGHVNIRSHDDVSYSKELFLRSNPFVGPIVEDELIYQLAMGNNSVDEYSTVMLKLHKDDTPAVTALSFGYSPFNMREYSNLVNKGGHRPL